MHGIDRALFCVPFVRNVFLLRLVRLIPLASEEITSLFTLSVFQAKLTNASGGANVYHQLELLSCLSVQLSV
jgi:hypothetical protein